MGYMVSTKGRYALRVLVDLAQHPDELQPLKDIADRQGISLKYMETIMPSLRKAGFVDGTHGKGGGYRLARPAETYSVGEILRVTEGSTAPVACLDSKNPCERAAFCPTLPVWKELDSIINDYLDSVKLTDLIMKGEIINIERTRCSGVASRR